MVDAGFGPEKLFVYECRGDGPPGREPADAGFLGMLPEPPYYYFFFAWDASSRMARWLEDRPGWSLTDIHQLDYDCWQEIPRAGERIGPFAICSGWRSEEFPPQPDHLLIRLNPGLVFGSGAHPSTKGCLLAIAGIMERERIESVVDLGTGTGILAIASALLGASRVIASDRIPLAAGAARDNVRRNGLTDVVDVLVADGLDALNRPFDLLIMNLEWPFLKRILQKNSGLACCAHAIVSGFLHAQWNELRAAIPASFRLAGLEVLEGWGTAVLSR